MIKSNEVVTVSLRKGETKLKQYLIGNPSIKAIKEAYQGYTFICKGIETK